METLYILYIVLGLLTLPMLIWGVVTQFQVSSTFNYYSQKPSRSGYTADAVARTMLDSHGLTNINIVRTKGHLTDHFDPKKKIIALSEDVFGSTSVSAIGVAAHECGHAIQHKENYMFIKLRTALVPVMNLLSYMFLPLVIVGIVLSAFGYLYGPVVIYVSLAFYAIPTLFYLVTLPVEINASNRAIEELKKMGIMDQTELAQTKSVLRAAAMTYIVSFLTSLLYLLQFVVRLLLILGVRRK